MMNTNEDSKNNELEKNNYMVSNNNGANNDNSNLSNNNKSVNLSINKNTLFLIFTLLIVGGLLGLYFLTKKNPRDEYEYIEADRQLKELDEIYNGKSSYESGSEESNDSWPKSEKIGFIKSCKENAMQNGASNYDANIYCDCSLFKIMEEYPNFEDTKYLSIEELTELTSDCN